MGNEKHPAIFINSITFYLLPYLLWKLYDPTKSNVNFFNKILTAYLLISAIYGIFEAVTANNIFTNMMNDIGLISNVVSDSYRRYGFFRARAFTIWCSIFGTICGVGLAYLLLQFFTGYIKFRIKSYILFFLLIFGVIISGTRSVIIMTLILLCSVIPYVKKNLSRVLIPLFIFLLVSIIFDINLLNNVIDSFVHQDSTEGSSIEMREIQYEAAYSLFVKSPIYGYGLGFISNAIELDSNLLGGESIIFSVLIDRGFIGVISLLLLYGQIFFFLIKKRMYFLCFFPIGFACVKVLSLIPGLNETYILFFLIPLIKQFKLATNGNKNDHLS